MQNIAPISIITVVLSLAGAAKAVDFSADIRPILSENCFSCHGPAEQEGKLRLDHPNDAVLGKTPGSTALWKRISETDPDEVMPPPDSHKSLTDAEKGLLREWLKSGAEYGAHWALAPLKEGKSIDQAIKHQQSAAPKYRQLRRLALDLIGLPPELSDVKRFENGEVTYEEMVDAYLASPHYGENMARFWLDAARYSDTHGLQNDYYRSIWPYRDWVINAFNNNMPFDQFSIRQLAGDMMPGARPEDQIATGFLKCNPSTNEGGIIDEEYRVKYLGERTSTVAKVWLGLTAECAACHDHKYDPLSQRDYYAMTAFFANVDEPVKNGDNSRGNGPTLPYTYSPQAKALTEKIIAQLPARKDDATLTRPFAASMEPVNNMPKIAASDAFSCATWLTTRSLSGAVVSQMSKAQAYRGWNVILNNGLLAVQLINTWPRSAIMVEPKTPIKVNEVMHVAMSYDGSGKAAGVKLYVNGKQQELKTVHDSLAGEVQSTAAYYLLSRNGQSSTLPATLADFRHYTRVLADDEVAALAAPLPEALVKELKAARPGHTSFTLVARERTAGRVATHVLNRGVYSEPVGEPLEPDTPSMLHPFPDDLERSRLGFAKWLFLPENPLTARVVANRIWAQFFGEGIVKTAADFGNQGTPPRNPELLEYLASNFHKDWDVKKLVKTIVSSDAYRQSSVLVPGKSRAPRHRLDAELIRDNALAISGLLVPTLGGPTVKPYQPAGVWRSVATSISDTSVYKAQSGDNLYRRSIYTIHKRTANPPIMSNFDAPSRQQCSVQRERTNTPLQALQLMNDPQFVEAARALAARAQQEPDPIRYMYERATCRTPTPEERRILDAKLIEFEKADAKPLLSVGQSEATAPVAQVLLASMILNLDAVICK